MVAKTSWRREHGIQLLTDPEGALRPPDAGSQLLEVGDLGEPSQLGPAWTSADAIGVHVAGDQREVDRRPSRGIVEDPRQLRVLVGNSKDVEMDGVKPQV